MAQGEIKGWIVGKQYDPGTRIHTVFADGEKSLQQVTDDWASHGFVPICPYTITFDLPDESQFVGAQIAALKREEAKVRAEMHARIQQIREQLWKLSALEHKAEA